MDGSRSRRRGGGTLAAALALLAAGLAAPAAAQPIDTQQDINDIRNATPRCADHPDWPWVGRVSGNTQGILDQTIPVSFVGCFPDERSCERWKGQASRIITTTIIQYSCTRRF